MLNKRFLLTIISVLIALATAACNAGAPNGMTVAGSSGVRTWLDLPFAGANLPLAPFTLKAHARDVSGAGGVERIAFLVNTVALGAVNTDPTQPLVYAEFGWNPSVPGEYQIQAQAFDATGSALSEIAVVCVGDDCQSANPTISPQKPSNNVTPTPTATAAPQITCKGAPIISSFVATPSTLAAAGSTTLTWSASNADRVELGGVGVVGLTGSQSASVPATTTFSLVAYCGGKDNFVQKSVTVTVSKNTACSGLPVVAFSASPTAVNAGGSSTLSWKITNASEVALVGIGIVGASGSRVVTPGATTTYTLTAFCGSKANLVERSVTVTVKPAAQQQQTGCSGTPNIASFSASPSTITAGGSSVLSWGAVTNADSVSIDQGVGGVPAPGSRNVSPGGTTIYTMTARCGNNFATKQATVTVSGAAPPPPPPPPPPPQDTTPPNISGVKPNSSTLTDQSGCTYPTSLVVTASVTDASSIASVQLYYRFGTTGSWSSVAMSPAGGSGYSGTVDVGNQFKGKTGTIHYYITARDNAGNSSNSSTLSVSFITCPG